MIPLQTIDIFGIGTGPAILLVGVMALLLWATVQFRNPLGATMWGITVLVLVFSGLFGLGVEYLWLSITATVLIVIVGILARTMN